MTSRHSVLERREVVYAISVNEGRYEYGGDRVIQVVNELYDFIRQPTLTNPSSIAYTLSKSVQQATVQDLLVIVKAFSNIIEYLAENDLEPDRCVSRFYTCQHSVDIKLEESSSVTVPNWCKCALFASAM
jgi:hypothetical protein